jgi:hypothetical protein
MKSLEMLNTHTYTTEKERNKSDIKASGENGTEENRRSAYGIRTNPKAKKRTRKRTRKEEKRSPLISKSEDQRNKKGPHKYNKMSSAFFYI